MTDLSTTIAAKSTQLNADDMIEKPPRTITVTRVTATSEPEQPISIFFDGDGGKPYKPGKSMRRVLVQLWGKDGNAYVGRSMTIYRDPEVQFGGLKVGGIRISHMTDINGEQTLALAATKGAKRKYVVKPLRMQQEQQRQVEPMPDAIAAAIKAATGQPALVTIRGENEKEAWWPHVDRATRARLAELSQPEGQQDDDRSDQDGAGADQSSSGPEYDGV